MALLIFYVAMALGVSFLCSVMEAVLLSVTPAYVALLTEKGLPVGRSLRALKEEVDRPLAAILSLNTIAHTVGAAGAGAQAAVVFGSAYIGVASAVLTFLILVFSEIIPKTLGALYWRSLAPLVTRILIPTIWVMWPLVKMAQGLTVLMSRGEKAGTLRRDEFPALADVGVREGVLHEDESRMVRSLLKFAELRVEDVMTPRTVVFALSERSTVAQVLESNPEMIFARIPVYEKNIDQITGLVLRHDVLLAATRGQEDETLESIKREIMTVAPTLGLRVLLDRLRGARSHMALVVSEYGGTMGVITLEDAIETLIGLEIMDEADTVEDMRLLARQKWRDRARLMDIDPDAVSADP